MTEPALGETVAPPRSARRGDAWGRRLRDWLRPLALEAPVPRLAIGIGICIAALCALGGISYFVTDETDLGFFWLDGEHNAPAIFSALLLIAAALTAFVLAGYFPEGVTAHRALLFLAALFAFMSLDEFEFFHEHVNSRLHVPWQAVYAPIIAVGAVAAFFALRELMAQPPAGELWIAGAVAWALAQVIDLLQTVIDPGIHSVGFRLSVMVEETLEMSGSALFLFGLLLAIRGRATQREELKSSHRRGVEQSGSSSGS